MEINYELNPDDFVQFSKEIAPTQKDHKSRVIVLNIFYLAFIFADIIFALFSGSLKNWKFSEILLNIGLRTVLTFVTVLVVLGLIKLFARKKMNDVMSTSENGTFCEHRIILNENELIELTDVNTSRYSWKIIDEIKELENFVVINVLMSSSYVIPKRYFQDRKHIKNFLETANQYRQSSENSFQLSHVIQYEKSLE